ncbi:anti-sigma factor [Amaricoccus tamworthensis]|uniref:anti-sigma factor n=1 Tax=Amaricoccus tamworthensis TaxID=57002 RepID=UPI003C7E1463
MTGNERPLEERIDEVVIGLADEAECARIERMAAEDITVARMLDQARKRFGELDDTACPEALPDDMWARISGRLETVEPEPAIVSDPDVVPFPRPDNAPRAMSWATIGSLAASVVLAIALAWTLFSQKDPAVIAVLINDAGEPVAVVEGTLDNTTLITLLGPTTVPEGRIMQVWTKPDADGPPVSLGVLARPTSTRLEVENLPAPSANQLYEITFEQAGGSPTGLPTGPIHGKGLAQQPL